MPALQRASELIGAVESGSASLSPSDTRRLADALALVEAAITQLDTKEDDQ